MSNPISRISFSIVLTLALSGSVRADAQDLTFGLYANDKASQLVKSFRPLLDEIQVRFRRQSGKSIHIRMKVAKTYKQGIDDLVEGRVDFVRFGPASYIEAKTKQPQIEILAMESLNGKKFFNGVIVVHSASGIESLNQLKGTRFAFGARESTIGRYLAQALLVHEGIYAKDLDRIEYLGRHDKVGAAVAANLFDAGAIKEDSYLKMVAQGQPLKAIAVMNNVTKPWLARKGLPQRSFKALQDAILKIQDFSSLDEATGIVLGDDNDYQIIREAMAESKRFEQ